MQPNRLREKLDRGEPTIGTHVLTPWPGMIEVIGRSGSFDYVEYVGEYSSFSLEMLDNIGRAIDLFPEMSGMMKVEEQSRGFIATRAIDSGIQNVLFTDCRSADDAREFVRLVRAETPEAGGNHGFGLRRSIGYGAYGGAHDWIEAMNQVVIAVMIEKKGAMDELDAILEVDGVDMVQFGPSDYSITVGKPGEARGEEMRAVERDMIARALAASVHPRVEIGSLEQAKPYLDLGVRHFCVGWDLMVVAGFAREQSKQWQELAETLG